MHRHIAVEHADIAAAELARFFHQALRHQFVGFQ
jgi:hypothetical protein